MEKNFKNCNALCSVHFFLISFDSIQLLSIMDKNSKTGVYFFRVKQIENEKRMYTHRPEMNARTLSIENIIYINIIQLDLYLSFVLIYNVHGRTRSMLEYNVNLRFVCWFTQIYSFILKTHYSTKWLLCSFYPTACLSHMCIYFSDDDSNTNNENRDTFECFLIPILLI